MDRKPFIPDVDQYCQVLRTPAYNKSHCGIRIFRYTMGICRGVWAQCGEIRTCCISKKSDRSKGRYHL
jgi:hypothetical protein